MTEQQPYICPGCMVREPWEHRCCRDDENGRMCKCEECSGIARTKEDSTMAATHNDPAAAFDKAIREHRLNDNPHSSYFAGHFMYMGTWAGKDQFKHIETRKYLEVYQGTRTPM